MKLHDLRPAVGAHTRRTRVGRGIAAGGGKTAGRGTKGQKARAGGSIPAWFEGGQTPLHQRIPKLRGFKNPFKTQFEIVNLGRIAALVELGALEPGELPGAAKSAKEGAKPAKPAPITINQELLRAVGAVRTLDKPLKVLGHGEIDRPLFVVADAFSRTAVAKIEAAGGSVQVIELPTGPLAALGVEPKAARVAKSAEDKPSADEPVRDTADDAEAPGDDAPAKPVRRVTAAPSLGSPAPADEAEAPGDDAPAKPAKAAKKAKAEPVERKPAAATDAEEAPAKAPKAVRRATAAPSLEDLASETSAPSADAPAGEDA
jgi:large subunit ribosomal protein L15